MSIFKKYFLALLVVFLPGCSAIHPQYELPRNSYNAQHQYARVDNGYLEYYRFGRGTPIVLISGYITDISSWDHRFLDTLAKQHQVIVFNNRNVARSKVFSSQSESKDLANDAFQLIQNLHLNKPAILGISMGGMIAQKLATLHQTQLGSVILINTAISGKRAVRPNPIIENKMLNMPTNKLGRYSLAVNYFFPQTWRTQMAYALVAYRFQPLDYLEIQPENVLNAQRHLVLQWVNDDATAEQLKKLRLPVLILNGEADEIIPPINSVILAKIIPNSHLIRWPEGGHAMIFQFPYQMARVINNFLK